MIVEDINFHLSYTKRKKFIEKGVIVDSCVLLVYFLGLYFQQHPEKENLLKLSNAVTTGQIDCLNSIITNLQINTFIVTPYILSEFLNKLKSEYKQDYKSIKIEFIQQLKDILEIHHLKNLMLEHTDFVNFGNDVSLFIASEKQITDLGHSCIMSFDDRFIDKFYKKSPETVLAFKLKTLQYWF